MAEELRMITQKAKKRIAEERDTADQKRRQELEERLSKRLEKIHDDANKAAELGNDSIIVAKLPEQSRFWGQSDRIVKPSELPYGDERELAILLEKEGFTIHAGFYNRWGNEAGDPPPGSTYAYWAISWAAHSR